MNTQVQRAQFAQLVEKLTGYQVVWANDRRPYVATGNKALVTLTWKDTGGVGDDELRYTYYPAQEYNEQTHTGLRRATITAKAEAYGALEGWQVLDVLGLRLQRPTSLAALRLVNMALENVESIVDVPTVQDNRAVSVAILDIKIAYCVEEVLPPDENPGWIESVTLPSLDS